MALSNLQQDIQMHPEPEPESRHHAYKWVWGISVVILVAVIFVSIVLWQQGKFGMNESVDKAEVSESRWTPEEKLNLLDELNKRAEAERLLEEEGLEASLKTVNEN